MTSERFTSQLSLKRLALCVLVIAVVPAAVSGKGLGIIPGAENAYASCATTDYWNVSWCIYNPHTGVTKVRMCCSTTQGAYTVTDPAGYVIKFLHHDRKRNVAERPGREKRPELDVLHSRSD